MMFLVEWLAEAHTIFSRHPVRNAALSLSAVLACISWMDYRSPGAVLLPDDSLKRAAELELFNTLNATAAERSMFARFRDGNRTAVTVVSRKGVGSVPKPNQFISLKEYGYSDLYSSHKAGKCWVYKPGNSPVYSSLAVGMETLGAKVLIACPTYRNGSLDGSVSVSYDSELIDISKAVSALKAESKKFSELTDKKLGAG